MANPDTMPVPGGSNWHLFAPDPVTPLDCYWCGAVESAHYLP